MASAKFRRRGIASCCRRGGALLCIPMHRLCTMLILWTAIGERRLSVPPEAAAAAAAFGGRPNPISAAAFVAPPGVRINGVQPPPRRRRGGAGMEEEEEESLRYQYSTGGDDCSPDDKVAREAWAGGDGTCKKSSTGTDSISSGDDASDDGGGIRRRASRRTDRQRRGGRRRDDGDGSGGAASDAVRSFQHEAMDRIRWCRSVEEVEKRLRGISQRSLSAAGAGAGAAVDGAASVAPPLGLDRIAEEGSSSFVPDEEDPYAGVNPNIAAAALRRVVDLRAATSSRLRRRRGRSRQSRSVGGGGGAAAAEARTDAEVSTARAVLPALLRIVGRAIFLDLRAGEDYIDGSSPPTDDRRNAMSPFSLLDVLYSLAKLREVKKLEGNQRSGGGTTEGGGGDLHPLADATCRAVASNDGGREYVRRVRPTSLVETVWALATLGMHHQTVLLGTVADRMDKGDVLGGLSGEELARGLWAYAALDRPHHVGMARSFMRRMRKLRGGMAAGSIVRALWSAGRLVDRLDAIAAMETMHDGPVMEGAAELDLQAATLRHEAETMCHSLTDELMRCSNDEEIDAVGSQANVITKLQALTAGQVADVLSPCATFEMEQSEPIFEELSKHLRRSDVLATCKSQDIARILLSFQRLHLHDEVDTVQILGERFFFLVESDGGATCDGKTLNTVLRSVALVLAPKFSSSNRAFDAASFLLLGKGRERRGDVAADDEPNERHMFLSGCNEFEVSNYVWSFAQARKADYDDDLMVALANRMMERDIRDTCSPSSAARVLWSFTTLSSLREDSGEKTPDFQPSGAVDIGLRKKLFELFHSLGGILLSSQLTPIDSSSAMWAMAKASYPVDAGIFDHLAEVLANDGMLEFASVRQVALALWACGRMSSWENLRDDEVGNLMLPPYLESAKKYATFLLSLKYQMTPKDVAQSVWALGRLRIADRRTILGFASAAAEVAPSCNAKEIASILWGLTTLGFDDSEVIKKLTGRIAEPSVLQLCSPREAATIMYSLARIQLRDTDLFAILSSAMMQKLDGASPQAIANAFAAHEAVNIVPPRALFDCWANEKLGILGRHSNKTSSTLGDAIGDVIGQSADFQLA